MVFNNITDVKRFINEKIQQHIPHKWVTVEYTNRLTCFGRCIEYRDTKQFVLQFNLSFLELNLSNYELIKNVVLHEIAHVIAGGLHHHDSYWRRVCLNIGGNGLTLVNTKKENVIHKKTYVYKCPECGRIVETHKAWRKSRACCECCDKYNNGKYTEKYKLERVS